MATIAIKDAPLRYEPSFECEEEGETETARKLADALRGILDTTSKDYGHAVRSVHAKSHGLLTAEIAVPPGLPEHLRYGAFAKAGTYPLVTRFSTNPGDLLDDSVTVPRGLAIKIIGVEGERLPGSADARTQDFVMVNGPVFSAPDARTFLTSLKGLADHRPLGSINRVRRPTYDMSAGYRSTFNGCPIHEPASREDVDI